MPIDKRSSKNPSDWIIMFFLVGLLLGLESLGAYYLMRYQF